MTQPTPDAHGLREPDWWEKPLYPGGPKLARAMRDVAAVVKSIAAVLRRYGLPATAYHVWRMTGRKNPARQEGSRAAGEAVALRMSKTERASRAAAGGRALFHGGQDVYDPGHARTFARQMQRLQSATRRGERKPKKRNRLDVSRSKLQS